MNFRKYPGMTYPIGLNTFNNLPMDKDSPYARSWWYRTEFQLPATYTGKSAWLHFKGINYRANLWINGKKLADAKDVAGAYNIHEFNVTSFVTPGAPNVLESRSLLLPRKNLASTGWTGILRPQIKTWASGATCTSPHQDP